MKRVLLLLSLSIGLLFLARPVAWLSAIVIHDRRDMIPFTLVIIAAFAIQIGLLLDLLNVFLHGNAGLRKHRPPPTGTMTLQATNGSMVLDCNEKGWCRVRLQVKVDGDGSPGDVSLGADAWNLITHRLYKALRAKADLPASGKYQRREVCHVLSLMDPHSAIYACADDADDAEMILFFQDQSTRMVGELRLSDANRRAWLKQLA